MPEIESRDERRPLIETNQLSVDFWNQIKWVNVVNRVSFAVFPGEAVGLVGESGCGKTTTAYTLLGYRRPNSRITAGNVYLKGQDLLRMSDAALRRIRGKQISLVPQNPTTTLSPGMRVGTQIHEVLTAHGIGASNRERQEFTHELLERVRLPEPGRTARKYPHQLSGGQQQRVIIAIALACNPELLVLDEPTTGLDVTTQAQILELLQSLRQEHDMAMVYVTHDLSVVASICDRVGVMYAGELVEDGLTREVFINARHPYTRGLIASVPSIHPSDQGDINPLQGILKRDELPAGCRFAPRCTFALEQCFVEPQVGTTAAVDHQVACWRWSELPHLAAQQQVPFALPARQMASASESVLLQVNDLDYAYEHFRLELFSAREPRLVLRDVSFNIRPRETFALVGESGSGKSTIARAAAGLIVPTSGRIMFDGENITLDVKYRPQQLRRDIQLVFQNPDASLNPRQKVLKIIGRPLRIFYGFTGAKLQQRVEELLGDVSLDRTYINRYPDELSGGERQRIAIARALAAEPRLMLCDEILSALDVSVQSNILNLLRTLQVEHELAYLFISHDLAVVRSLAHRVGVLYRGELCEYGMAEEVYSPPFHPYTHMLLSAVPQITTESKPASVHIPIRSVQDTNVGKVGCPFADRCPWKIGRECEEVHPPWQRISDTHAVRCHIPIDELHQLETWSKSESARPSQ